MQNGRLCAEVHSGCLEGLYIRTIQHTYTHTAYIRTYEAYIYTYSIHTHIYSIHIHTHIYTHMNAEWAPVCRGVFGLLGGVIHMHICSIHTHICIQHTYAHIQHTYTHTYIYTHECRMGSCVPRCIWAAWRGYFGC